MSRLSENLLNTLADVLDIREVLPRVSEIVAAVLPHDRMTVGFADGQDEFVAHAASNDDGPLVGRVKFADPGQFTAPGFTLVRDLAREVLPIIEPVDVWEKWLAAGYRSFLAAHVSTRFQELSVCLWSKQPRAFNRRDLPVVRRLADYVNLVLSHQQLAEAGRQVAEAQARAERLEVRAKSLAAELDLRSGLGRAIGHSPEWTNVLKHATQVAATDTTALVQGESGTGKEVVARFIHRASPRKNGPFVAINCAALPEHLLESGAVRLRAGGIYRGPAVEGRPDRTGIEWRAVPRRNHRDESVGPGEVPAGAAGARVSATRGHAADQGERAGDRGDEPRPAQGGGARHLSRRPATTDCRCSRSRFPRCGIGKATCCRSPMPSCKISPIRSVVPCPASRRTRSARYSNIAGRGTSASYAMPWNGRRSCARAA